AAEKLGSNRSHDNRPNAGERIPCPMAFFKLALSGNRNMYRYPRPNQVHMNPRSSLLVNHGCGRGFASFKFSGKIERLPTSLRLCAVREALSGGNLSARLPRKAA